MNTPQSSVSLRAMEPEDLELLYKIENDTQLWNVGSTNVPYSRYTLHDYIATSSDDIYADHQVRMMVENQEGRVVGIVDVVNFDAKNRRAEVGVIILNELRRQGYGYDTLKCVADYALRILHLHQLYAVVDASNLAAVNLFAKADYQQSATLPAWLYDGKDYHDALLMQRIF